LLTLIGGAYRVEDHQISGAPHWLNSEKYDIAAQIPQTLSDQLHRTVLDKTGLAGIL
jgi:uncharacterized protein (TIGR03435 family)